MEAVKQEKHISFCFKHKETVSFSLIFFLGQCEGEVTTNSLLRNPSHFIKHFTSARSLINLLHKIHDRN